jgi:hypothetical protein
VAVLHTRVELDLATGPGAQRGVERFDHHGRLVGRRVAPGEVEHRAVGPDVDQVAAEGDLVGPQTQTQRRRLDGRPAGVVAGRVVAEDRHVPHVAAGRHLGRDHRRPPDLAPRRQRRQRRHGGGLQRRAPTQLVDGLVGAAVGDADHVLHRTSLAGAALGPTTRPGRPGGVPTA